MPYKDHEKKKAKNREYTRKLMADPEKLAKKRARNLAYYYKNKDTPEYQATKLAWEQQRKPSVRTPEAKARRLAKLIAWKETPAGKEYAERYKQRKLARARELRAARKAGVAPPPAGRGRSWPRAIPIADPAPAPAGTPPAGHGDPSPPRPPAPVDREAALAAAFEQMAGVHRVRTRDWASD